MVSVVCPTFNAHALLRETLQSVFAQTFHDFEVVVIDDGCTDETPQMLQDLQQLYGLRLRVVRQENQGIGAARNRGVVEARGRYIALLDHDDIWLPRKLEVQVAFLKANRHCIAAVVPFVNSNAPQSPAFDVASLAGPDGIVANPLRKLAENHAFMTTSSVLMFDRERAAGLRYATSRGAIEDAPFYIKLLARGAFGIAGRDVLVIYRVHAGGSSRRPEYFYRGLHNLRQLDREGGFAELPGAAKQDLAAYLAFIGRLSAMQQLFAGARGKGALVYIKEFPHQLRQRRGKFLVSFLPLLLLPKKWVWRRWGHQP